MVFAVADTNFGVMGLGPERVSLEGGGGERGLEVGDVGLSTGEGGEVPVAVVGEEEGGARFLYEFRFTERTLEGGR